MTTPKHPGAPTRSNAASLRLRGKRRPARGSQVGDDLVAAFEQMAAHLRGEIELEEGATAAMTAATGHR
jgi:hypothetical protein